MIDEGDEAWWTECRNERLPEYFIRYVGHLVTRRKRHHGSCGRPEEPAVEANYPPLGFVLPIKECHSEEVQAFLDSHMEEQRSPQDSHPAQPETEFVEKVACDQEEVGIELSELGQSLSMLLAEAARLGDPEHPDLTGLQLSNAERAKMKLARKTRPVEEIEGRKEQLEPEIFVQKILETSGIAIFASSKCPFCSRLQYLFEMHDKCYKIIRLDKMGEYGKSLFQYILNNWLDVKVPNLYFHGKHVEEEDLSGEIGRLNALSMCPPTTDPTVYDLIILGGGLIGVEAALAGADLKMKVCLIDCAQWSGSTDQTCLNLDLLTKRYFHQTAVDLHQTKEAACYTWKAWNLNVNWPFLVRKVLEDLRKADWEYRVRLRKAGVCYLNTKSLLLDKNTVEVGIDTTAKLQLRSKHIILAVDAKAYIPQIPGKEHCITSSEVLLRQIPPGKVLIVGGSTQAVELAFILRSLDFPVSLMVSGSLLNNIDQEIATEIVEKLNTSGIEVLRDCLFLRVELLKAAIQKTDQNSSLLLRNSYDPPGKTSLDSSKSKKKSNVGQNTFDGPKKAKGKKGKGKKGKVKGKKKNKKTTRAKKQIVQEETESQKALIKKNTDLFRLIKKIINTKKLSGKYFDRHQHKRKQASEDLTELGVIGLKGNGFIHSKVYNTVVIAAGQVTSTRCYGFSKAGIHVNIGSGKIITNEQDETSIPGVYAVGEIVEGKSHGLASTVCAATNLVQRLLKREERGEAVRRPTGSLLLTPLEYAWAGLTEERSRACFSDSVRVLKKSFWPLASTFLEESSGKTLLKLLTLHQPGKKEEVIGIHILGDKASAAVLGLSVAMKKGLFLEDMDKFIPTDFTYAEELSRMNHKKISVLKIENLIFTKPEPEKESPVNSNSVDNEEQDPAPLPVTETRPLPEPPRRTLSNVQVHEVLSSSSRKTSKNSRVTFEHSIIGKLQMLNK